MLPNLFSKTLYTLGLTIWVMVSLVLGQTLAALLLSVTHLATSQAVVTTIEAALGYMLALLIALGVPTFIGRKPISKKTLGVAQLPTWSDLGLGVLAGLPYYIVSGILLWLGIGVFRFIDPEVGQQAVFSHLSQHVEYFVAFVTLVIMAPVAEELLFRGYFLGRLSERISKWLAVLVTAVAFALMHVPGFTESGQLVLQWGAATDTFALALVAGSMRMVTGRIWAGVLLHALKNAVAFYFLFIAPLPHGGM